MMTWRKNGAAPEPAEGQLQQRRRGTASDGPVRAHTPRCPRGLHGDHAGRAWLEGPRLGVDEPRDSTVSCLRPSSAPGRVAWPQGAGNVRKLVSVPIGAASRCPSWGHLRAGGHHRTDLCSCPALPRPAALPVDETPMSTPWRTEQHSQGGQRDTQGLRGAASSHWGAACPPGPGRGAAAAEGPILHQTHLWAPLGNILYTFVKTVTGDCSPSREREENAGGTSRCVPGVCFMAPSKAEQEKRSRGRTQWPL